jgi:hypothetical protein
VRKHLTVRHLSTLSGCLSLLLLGFADVRKSGRVNSTASAPVRESFDDVIEIVAHWNGSLLGRGRRRRWQRSPRRAAQAVGQDLTEL